MAREYPNVSEMNYFTNRKLENKNGEKTGKILMWRLKGDEQYNIEMKCPFCETVQAKKETFSRRPFRVSCEKCGETITMAKIKKK